MAMFQPGKNIKIIRERGGGKKIEKINGNKKLYNWKHIPSLIDTRICRI